MKEKGQFGNISKIIVLLLLFILIASFKTGYAQDDVIRVDTDLVLIPATVLDRDGRYVTNLKKEDFQIFEDGIEQEVSLFEPTEQPFTVLLLLDRSGSMGRHMEELANASSTFVKQLRPNDQLIAATFANNVDVLFQATKIKDLGKGIKLRPHPADNNTMIYDAVDFALKKMKKVRGRKAIVLFSDGAGTELLASPKSNLRDAEEQEAFIYTVQFNTFTAPHPKSNVKAFYKAVEVANNYMRDLAQVTGGRSYNIEDIANLDETFSLIANELGQQYSLSYYPKIEAGQKREVRQIKVKVRQPNLVVRARESYVIEPK
ncbi:MAG: VWA domain-containing protein [Acidobacteriota bacterium]|nr:VWA domain-containing protein [Acidobacteriota bacterium]